MDTPKHTKLGAYGNQFQKEQIKRKTKQNKTKETVEVSMLQGKHCTKGNHHKIIRFLGLFLCYPLPLFSPH